tara:strand:- start:1706 stop:2023 length:318 start_codon:yes stop_codon:yes gene_type:complete
MRNYSEKELLKEMKTARKALRCAVLSLSIINNEVIGSNYNFRKEEDNDTLDEIFIELNKMEEDFNSLRRSGEKARKNCERVHSCIGARISGEELRLISAGFSREW